VTYKGLAASLKVALNGDGVSVIRYPSGCEDEKVKEVFYSNGGFDDIGIKTDFSSDVVPEHIIVTHGKIAKECLAAKEALKERGMSVGIILCECISPYSELAQRIINVISGKNIKSITFVEEEIRAGGFGMLLSDELRKSGYLDSVDYSVMAADDAFISIKEGETYLSASGLDRNGIINEIEKYN